MKVVVFNIKVLPNDDPYEGHASWCPIRVDPKSLYHHDDLLLVWDKPWFKRLSWPKSNFCRMVSPGECYCGGLNPSWQGAFWGEGLDYEDINARLRVSRWAAGGTGKSIWLNVDPKTGLLTESKKRSWLRRLVAWVKRIGDPYKRYSH